MKRQVKHRFNQVQLKKLSSICADLGKAAIIGSSGLMAVKVLSADLDIASLEVILSLVGEFIGGLLIGFSVKLLKETK